jgi:GNAT superfamily N-acetyltransferase
MSDALNGMKKEFVGGLKTTLRGMLSILERFPSVRSALHVIGFELAMDHRDGPLNVRTLYEWIIPLSESQTTEVQLRPFVREQEEADVQRVFWAAFAWHPEVGPRDGSVGGRLCDPSLDPTNVLVHEIDGKIAAFGIVGIVELAGRPTGFVDVFAIDPGVASRGLGTGLERALANHFFERGLKWMTLTTESTNYAMNRIQLRAGGSIYRLRRVEGPPLHIPLPGGSSPPS